MHLRTSIALVAALVLGQATALAAPPEETVSLTGNGQTVFGEVKRAQRSSAHDEGHSPSEAAPPAPPPPVVTRTKQYIEYDYSNSGRGQMRYVFDNARDYCSYDGASLTCFGPKPPKREARPRRAAPAVTPEDIVERTLVNAKLPSPRPNIDPGYAVTGMRAYLETGDRRTHRFETIPTVLGPLQITATSTYTVDWGDGTVTGPHDSTGGKYPDGTITHVYEDTGTVDVTVSQTWAAQWSLAGRSGTVDGLGSSGTIEDFAVQEVQAVRTH